ncbi:MAG TPA: glycosyltransferase family 2 protein [Gaiellaceae bacterium]|nr:glycosyltransferase family 2 protein [Gaiellaceae bacterium]
MSPRLSVLVPVHNEERTLPALLDAVEARPEVYELVIVDDGSTDATAEILVAREFRVPAQVIHHSTNRGKGSAIRTAIAAASGDVAVIQDADLEYDPADLPSLLAPLERQGVDVVFGTRSFSSHSAYSFWFVMGNKAVTLWNNVLFNSYLSDLETCYKLMPLEIWRLDLRSNGFEIEPEITAKLLRHGYRIFKVPISYAARSRAEGKKLTYRDGVRAVWTLGRIRASRRPAAPATAREETATVVQLPRPVEAADDARAKTAR